MFKFKTLSKEQLTELLLKTYKENNYKPLTTREINNNKNLPSRCLIEKIFNKPMLKIWEEVLKETSNEKIIIQLTVNEWIKVIGEKNFNKIMKYINK